jgi:hypothetical protein
MLSARVVRGLGAGVWRWVVRFSVSFPYKLTKFPSSYEKAVLLPVASKKKLMLFQLQDQRPNERHFARRSTKLGVRTGCRLVFSFSTDLSLSPLRTQVGWHLVFSFSSRKLLFCVDVQLACVAHFDPKQFG